jgi:hypothetical protein
MVPVLVLVLGSGTASAGGGPTAPPSTETATSAATRDATTPEAAGGTIPGDPRDTAPVPPATGASELVADADAEETEIPAYLTIGLAVSVAAAFVIGVLMLRARRRAGET